MPRRAFTVEADEKLLAAAKAVAERTGVPVAELYDLALRDVFARDFAELMRELVANQSETGQVVGETDGLGLAYDDELRAARANRRNAS